MPETIKQPPSPKAQENVLGDMLQYMVGQITQRFEVNVLRELSKESARQKFEDALPSGNYARMLVKLAADVRRKIRRQFDDARIESMVAETLGKADRRQKELLYSRIEDAIGISTKQLILRDGMTYEINALVTETAQWVKKLRDETLETFTNNTLHAMTTGDSLETIVGQFKDIAENRKGHAKYLARNQIQNFNAIAAKTRVSKLGITKAVWETAGDESVRPSHADRDGKEFDLAKGLYSSVDGQYLIPGVDHNCRCIAIYVLDEDENENAA